MPESKSIRELKELLGRLSGKEAEKLLLAVERDKLAGGRMPHDLLLDALRPRLQERDEGPHRRGGAPTPVRHLCGPFEELLVNERGGRKHRGRIPRTSILPVWQWLSEDCLPDTLSDISQRIVQHTLTLDEAGLDAAVAVLHASCGEAILRALETAKPRTAERRKLAERLGDEDVLEDAREMGVLLSVAPRLLSFKERLPKAVEELDPGLAAEVRDLFDELVEEHPDAAPYAAVIAMSHIEKPWQIFRIVKGVAHTNTDVLISRTDISIVGELLLLDMENAVTRVETIDPASEPEEVARSLARFTRISRGITEEIGIRRDGAWATRLMSARGAVSEIIRERLERVPGYVIKALPMRSTGRFGRGGPKRPDLSRELDPQLAARAMNAVTFLDKARRYAEAGSFTGAINASTAEVEKFLDDYERGIVEELRCDDKAIQERGEAYLDAVADLVEVLRGEEEASLLRRRGVVARNAAIA